jgi:protein-S-isoprenylcysteine O-methyltransferase Ste14
MPRPQEPEILTKPQISFSQRLLNLTAGSAMTFVWIAMCFGGAGHWEWVRGWICVSTYLVVITVTGGLVRYFNPQLMERRGQWVRSNTALFDRVFLVVFVPLTFIQPLVAGLDAERFHWMPLPSWTTPAGIVLFLAAMSLVTQSMVANPFAETSVRIQAERGHRVITSGPYRLVRHPMNLGSLLIYPATGLMFGSGWAMVVAAIIVLMFVWRTAREDRFLSEHLEGYRRYALRTRYRLVPGLW